MQDIKHNNLGLSPITHRFTHTWETHILLKFNALVEIPFISELIQNKPIKPIQREQKQINKIPGLHIIRIVLLSWENQFLHKTWIKLIKTHCGHRMKMTWPSWVTSNSLLRESQRFHVELSLNINEVINAVTINFFPISLSLWNTVFCVLNEKCSHTLPH